MGRAGEVTRLPRKRSSLEPFTTARFALSTLLRSLRSAAPECVERRTIAHAAEEVSGPKSPRRSEWTTTTRPCSEAPDARLARAKAAVWARAICAFPTRRSQRTKSEPGELGCRRYRNGGRSDTHEATEPTESQTASCNVLVGRNALAPTTKVGFPGSNLAGVPPAEKSRRQIEGG
jgi:hypothetical protein